MPGWNGVGIEMSTLEGKGEDSSRLGHGENIRCYVPGPMMDLALVTTPGQALGTYHAKYSP